MSIEPDLQSVTKQNFIQKVEKDLTSLKIKQAKAKNAKVFVRYVFNYLHQNYLKNYFETANFTQIITQKRYNCVSGTALIGYFLERLGYVCKYYETERHTFLMLQITPEDRILVESTAFFSGGLIDNEEQIDIEFRKYQPIAQIQAIHLVGLQFYNEAVLAYRSQDYLKTLSLSNTAYHFYPSARHRALHQQAKQLLLIEQGYCKFH
ncbi:MAG: hypothetical protein OHK0045_09430 [Raineya sp.]